MAGIVVSGRRRSGKGKQVNPVWLGKIRNLREKANEHIRRRHLSDLGDSGASPGLVTPGPRAGMPRTISRSDALPRPDSVGTVDAARPLAVQPRKSCAAALGVLAASSERNILFKRNLMQQADEWAVGPRPFRSMRRKLTAPEPETLLQLEASPRQLVPIY